MCQQFVPVLDHPCTTMRQCTLQYSLIVHTEIFIDLFMVQNFHKFLKF